ncbi:hypothetical protein NH340_JMT08830 [Sarcoptes scabiei]|nr:hypothetical protein NH340_JMT08830 [Sarcoptes scabiei]
MKIDVHAHILPEQWPAFDQKFGYPGWIRIKHEQQQSIMEYDDGRFFRNIDDRVFSPEIRLKEMNRTGIDRQILSTVPVMFSYWSKGEDNEIVARFLNDHLASVVNCWPERFSGLGTVPLQNVTLAIKELIRCKTDLHLNGIIIGTHCNERTLDDPIFEPFWRAAEEFRMPIFIHPWDVAIANGRWSRYVLPYIVGMTSETTATALTLAFSGVFQRHPHLKVLLSHGGGSLPYLCGRAVKAFRVYPNEMNPNVALPPDGFLRRSKNIFSDTLVHDRDALNLALNFFGEESLMLGSDFPFLLAEQNPGTLIESMNFDASIQEKLLYKNAIKFFNIV